MIRHFTATYSRSIVDKLDFSRRRIARECHGRSGVQTTLQVDVVTHHEISELVDVEACGRETGKDLPSGC